MPEKPAKNGSGAVLGFEETLWASAKQSTIGKLLDDAMVAIEEVEEEEGVFEEKMAELTATLGKQFMEHAKLEKEVKKNLAGLGFAL